MLIRIFSPTECGLIRDADLKKCGLNRMTTVVVLLKSNENICSSGGGAHENETT
jgi:hypothetical protein